LQKITRSSEKSLAVAPVAAEHLLLQFEVNLQRFVAMLLLRNNDQL